MVASVVVGGVVDAEVVVAGSVVVDATDVVDTTVGCETVVGDKVDDDDGATVDAMVVDSMVEVGPAVATVVESAGRVVVFNAWGCTEVVCVSGEPVVVVTPLVPVVAGASVRDVELVG